LIKQVPDTKNITAKAMRDDGTVNRAALPAIFNPDDLCALELALRVRDQYGGSVRVISMGPLRALEILRDALSRGADEAVLLSDKRFAAADTLATSYSLSEAVKKIGNYDLIFCGRQAIDGDTAQVGPQVAEKLNIPQATYAQEIWKENGKVFVRREVEGGYEVLALKTPALITVTGGYVLPRPRSARRTIRFRNVTAKPEIEARWKKENPDMPAEELDKKVEAEASRCKQAGLLIDVWSVDDIGADIKRTGLVGSPTRVWRVENVTLHTGESKKIEPTEDGIHALVEELIHDHVLG
jgi:electron transfer flavoprotein beta subunit